MKGTKHDRDGIQPNFRFSHGVDIETPGYQAITIECQRKRMVLAHAAWLVSSLFLARSRILQVV